MPNWRNFAIFSHTDVKPPILFFFFSVILKIILFTRKVSWQRLKLPNAFLKQFDHLDGLEKLNSHFPTFRHFWGLHWRVFIDRNEQCFYQNGMCPSVDRALGQNFLNQSWGKFLLLCLGSHLQKWQITARL